MSWEARGRAPRRKRELPYMWGGSPSRPGISVHELFVKLPIQVRSFPIDVCAPALTPAARTARTARAAPAPFGLQTLFDLLRPRDTTPPSTSSSMSGLVRQCGAPCGSERREGLAACLRWSECGHLNHSHFAPSPFLVPFLRSRSLPLRRHCACPLAFSLT